MVEWQHFNAVLKQCLADANITTGIPSMEETFTVKVKTLTKCIQETIEEVVPQSRPSSFARHWWSKDLDIM